MEAVCSSETLMTTYMSSRCHNPEDHNFKMCRQSCNIILIIMRLVVRYLAVQHMTSSKHRACANNTPQLPSFTQNSPCDERPCLDSRLQSWKEMGQLTGTVHTAGSVRVPSVLHSSKLIYCTVDMCELYRRPSNRHAHRHTAARFLNLHQCIGILAGNFALLYTK
jgi:hypothetical protein